MNVRRFSAIEQFGIPIDDPELISQPERQLALFSAYGIEGQPVPTEPTDITPYYWRRPAFRYFVSQTVGRGFAVVEMLPTVKGSEAYSFNNVGPLTVVAPGIRRIVIPSEEPGMAIIGPGPRFQGQICIHEAIVAMLE